MSVGRSLYSQAGPNLSDDLMTKPVSREAARDDAGPRALPPESPLSMPIQSFGERPGPSGRFVSQRGMLERRLLLVLATLVAGLLAATEMARPVGPDGATLMDAALFMLIFSLFCWIAFGFVNALLGFVVLAGRSKGSISPFAGHALELPHRRTAILLPVYNEDFDQVGGRIQRMTTMLERAGAAALFDLFILSDSNPQAGAREEAAWTLLAADSAVPVYYRRRPVNIGRKPGNIAEWLGRFGGGYDHMIVLDADSLMSGEAMIRLATTMERSPGVGLIQTIPSVINGRTLFARWQQFAATAYGPIASAGLIWWSGSEATFWGHNAIIRVRAFAESCGLPDLRGAEPMGGQVMSHDMVEAAMLRRRGWAVHMAMLPSGSYEEFPPTLSDHAVRDRRWCQGNLQHLRLLNSGGFHWINRLQLFMGASAYLTSPMWLLLLTMTIAQGVGLVASPAFSPSGWPLALTALLLFSPKLLAFAWLMIDQRRQASLGGVNQIVRSMAVEIPLSILVAPITMLAQTMAVIDIARGRASGWRPQRRDADGIPILRAMIDYIPHVMVGLAFAILLTMADRDVSLWLMPVVASLLLAPVITSITSRQDIGDWLARKGVFAAREDRAVLAPRTAARPIRIKSIPLRTRRRLPAPANDGGFA